MLKRMVSGMMVTLLLIGMLTLVFNVQPVKAEPATIIVPDDYSSIQEAIHAANPRDQIMVRNGTYHEWITVNKTVSVFGEYEHGSVVDGLSAGTIFSVLANNVSIFNFTIRNGGTHSIVYSGIHLNNVMGCNVQNNYITQCNRGVSISSSSHNNVIKNYLSSDLWTGGYDLAIGIMLSGSANNTVAGNIADTNCGDGISLHNSHYNAVSNNVASANGLLGPSHPGYGIYLRDSNHNTIISNNITDNQYGGMWLYNSIGNNLYYNNFVNNGIFGGNDAQVWNAFNSVNTWDDGYPSGGNYWSDYEERYPDAEERDGSGIWDTPYVMDTENVDRFPLMHPWIWPTEIHDIAIVDAALSKTVVGQGFSVSINVTTENQGGYTENFNVTAYANKTIIGTLTNFTLASGNSTTITFTWNTTDWAKGNYTISTYATAVPGEIDTTDNNFTDGWVFVTIQGDVDGDRDVDIYDVVKITGIYGSKRGDPQFNPNSDLDDDDEIKIYDVVMCTSHYRQSW